MVSFLQNIRAAFQRPISRRLVRAVAVTALVTILTAITTYASINRAFEVGRLSISPTYDDVSYFLGAANWLSDANTRSVAANLYALLDQHAPLCTLMAIIGFELTPGTYVGPYVINAIIIGAFLIGINRFVWHLSLVNMSTCLIAAACVPVLGQTIAEARPDLPWGLALGIALSAIVYQSLATRSYRSIFCLGALCGFAVAVKPSAFPGSVACILFAACAALTCDYFAPEPRGLRTTEKHALKTMLIFFAGLFIASMSIVGIRFMGTVQYILSALIYNRDFWAAN